MRRRRYDDPYGYPPPRRYGRRYGGGGGGSCLRDACLLETGCCVGEAITDNCLLAGVLLVPQFFAALRSGATRPPASRPSVTRPSATRPASERSTVRAMVAAIGVYQREISAKRPACCRFSPSCSHYAVEALRTHGAARGLMLTARRLVRCRPGGRRGPDPVPPRRQPGQRGSVPQAS